MAMVDVMVRRRRREARARMGAAIAYGAMGWPVCAAAHPPWPAGFRAAVFRSPGFRATGFGAPAFRSMGRRGTGFGAGQPGGSAQQGFAQPGGMGRACSCDRICCPDSITETPGLRWHCRDSYVLAPPSRHISGHDAHWIRAPEGRPLPDSLRILPVLVDACEEVAG